MKTNNIAVFDTTLRDGEQSPGASMSVAEKIEVAKFLEEMKVDVMEAGFAFAYSDDFFVINYDFSSYVIKNIKVISGGR